MDFKKYDYLPQHIELLTHVKTHVSSLLKDVYDNVVSEKCYAKLKGKSFDEFFEELVCNEFNNSFFNVLIMQEKYSSFTNALYQTKYRWNNKVQNEKDKEGTSTSQIALQVLKEQVNNWKEDSNSYLFQCVTFNGLTAGYMLKAFRTDLLAAIVRCCYNPVKKGWNDDLIPFTSTLESMMYHATNGMIVQPEYLCEIPAFSANPTSIEFKRGIDGTFFNIEQLADSSYLKTNIASIAAYATPDTSQKVINLKMLDAKDSLIIGYVYSRINIKEALQNNTSSVIIPMRDLEYLLYRGNHSSSNYRTIRERLKRVSNYKLELLRNVDGEILTTHLNFFDMDYMPLENGGIDKNTFVFTPGTTLLNAYIQKETVSISLDDWNSLKNNLSRLFLYSLNKTRLQLYFNSQECNNEHLVTTLDYEYFISRVRFSTKRISTNLKLITSALSELKDSNILIQDFKKLGEKIEVTFLPLGKEEIMNISSFDQDLTYIEQEQAALTI